MTRIIDVQGDLNASGIELAGGMDSKDCDDNVSDDEVSDDIGESGLLARDQRTKLTIAESVVSNDGPPLSLDR